MILANRWRAEIELCSESHGTSHLGARVRLGSLLSSAGEGGFARNGVLEVEGAVRLLFHDDLPHV
jgi:hypothetical protein